jgi:hypothetical protein
LIDFFANGLWPVGLAVLIFFFSGKFRTEVQLVSPRFLFQLYLAVGLGLRRRVMDPG